MELRKENNTSNGKEFIEFYLCETNSINPHFDETELGIVVLSDGKQIDFSLSLSETEQLIGWLKATMKHIVQREKIKKG